MKRKIISGTLIPLLLVFLFASGSMYVSAAEMANVRIPVSAAGADCTAVLLNEDGNTPQTVMLTDGETSVFEFNCDGLGSHKFQIMLTDQDTAVTEFDKTKYTVDVELFDDENYDIISTIEADPLGVLGDGNDGKPGKLEFINTVKEKICKDDPPVQKIIKGKPANANTFTFVMKANDASYPMPEGSANGEKEVFITGEGEVEFGEIVFDTAGVYEYTVVEKNTGEAGYRCQCGIWGSDTCPFYMQLSYR